MSTAPEAATEATVPLVERFPLRALIEACLVVEHGVAAARDVEIGMMAGGGVAPGPFARADDRGLDSVLERLESLQQEHGDRFEPPLTLRRLVTQGRLGQSSGQGFFPYPRPDPGQDRSTVWLETRDDVAIAWLDNPPANALGSRALAELRSIWEEIEHRVRALVIASGHIFTFSAGADVKEFSGMDPGEGGRVAAAGHELMRAMEQSSVATVACVNSLAYGGGLELAMACDVRIAGESASFGQPEVQLGIIPGFGGTQRLPWLIGGGAAMEMILTGEPIGSSEALQMGLVNDVTPDLELFDVAMQWARKLADQPPIAVREMKRAAKPADLDDALRREQEAFGAAFSSQDAREGIAAFQEKREPEWRGQ